MVVVDTLIEARWVVPVQPRGAVNDDHAVAVDRGRIVDVLPIASARERYSARETVQLWPAGARPGQGAKAAESEVPARGDSFHRITNVSDPTLTVFPVAQSNAPAQSDAAGSHQRASLA